MTPYTPDLNACDLDEKFKDPNPFPVFHHDHPITLNKPALSSDAELLTDLHKEECKEALNTITLRLRVARSHARWSAADLVALKQQRKILSTHMATLTSCSSIDVSLLRQIDHDLAVCHGVLSNPI